jgi:hypothetical protein
LEEEPEPKLGLEIDFKRSMEENIGEMGLEKEAELIVMSR